MVNTESYDKHDKRIVRTTAVTRPQSIERMSNGSWFINVEVDLCFELTDGRRVRATRGLRLRAIQDGTRPHPDPFGWKKKAAKSRKRGKAGLK